MLKNVSSKFSILIILLLSTALTIGNTTDVDSLKSLLNSTNDQLTIALINLELAKIYEQIDLNISKQYANEAVKYTGNDSLSAESYNQLGRNYFFRSQIDSALNFFIKARELFSKLDDQKRMAIIDISLGAIYLRQADYNKTIRTLTRSASYFENINDSVNAAKCYSNIASAMAELENYPKAIEFSEKALEIFESRELAYFQLITLPNLAAQYFKYGDTIKAIQYNLQAEILAKKMNNKRSLSIIYNNLGSIYLDDDPEKAKSYLEKTIKLKSELNLIAGIEVTQGNLGYIHLQEKNYAKAIFYYTEVAKQVKGKQLVFAYDQLVLGYKGLGDFKRAIAFSDKARALNDSILNSDNRKEFNEIQARYETEKAKRENSELVSKNLKIDLARSRNRNLLIILSVILVILLVVGYVHRTSSKRKHLLVQKGLKIKNQEFEQVLKNQELNGIDAIIDAQEKERSRIANDLHDNLGSKIATMKLYIEDVQNVCADEESEINSQFERLKMLADDSYREVRKIAHNKNTSALINKGLILATQSIARQISETSQLHIGVNNVDVNDYINNTIEIQVFRIIQELLTNIIKHADATEVNIQFSKENQIMIVMVEDNGKGFNVEETNPGYGLSNIQQRIEKLNGQIIIDSTLGNGTTIILNIPI